jgi:hypothetical protein
MTAPTSIDRAVVRDGFLHHPALGTMPAIPEAEYASKRPQRLTSRVWLPCGVCAAPVGKCDCDPDESIAAHNRARTAQRQAQ